MKRVVLTLAATALLGLLIWIGIGLSTPPEPPLDVEPEFWVSDSHWLGSAQLPASVSARSSRLFDGSFPFKLVRGQGDDDLPRWVLGSRTEHAAIWKHYSLLGGPATERIDSPDPDAYRLSYGFDGLADFINSGSERSDREYLIEELSNHLSSLDQGEDSFTAEVDGVSYDILLPRSGSDELLIKESLSGREVLADRRARPAPGEPLPTAWGRHISSDEFLSQGWLLFVGEYEVFRAVRFHPEVEIVEFDDLNGSWMMAASPSDAIRVGESGEVKVFVQSYEDASKVAELSFQPGSPPDIKVFEQSSRPLREGESLRRITGFHGEAVESGWFAIALDGVRIGGWTTHRDSAWSLLLPTDAMPTHARQMIAVSEIGDVNSDGVADRFWRVRDFIGSGSLWWIVSGATGELLKREASG